MKKISIIIFSVILIYSLKAQQGYKEIEKENEPFNVEKISGIGDRGGGSHNASNIGLFFENRGKLYPRRITQGPSGEYPINSGKHYIYRINPIVGIPGNVIQGRYTTNEEWEAAAGYLNSEISKIAFSDNPETWHPVNGWPVKDENGSPIFYSDQDSYCAYNDSNNTVKILGIQIDQIGYAYGVNFAQDLIFFKYNITNNGNADYTDLYFSLYSDIDVGNISGGAPEYGDDRIGFDKENNFVYFYDADHYSSEWPGGQTGYMGVAFLKTPEINGQQVGITDMHWNLYYDDRDIDTVQYGIMSSSESLYNSSFGSDYFHLGSNTNLHFDDTATVSLDGEDLVTNLSSGPYMLNRGDTLSFYTVIVAGDDKADLYYNLEQAYKVLQFNFEIAKPPSTPTLSGLAGDGAVNLYWDDVAELSKDNFSGEYDFEGYRIYKSVDKGVNWQRIAEFDLVNDIGNDRGLQYSFTDTDVINGFEYWYSITAYDRGDDEIEPLESPKGNNSDVKNLISVIPKSSALGREPVQSGNITHLGNGNSNYNLVVDPVDNESLPGNNYRINFGYNTRSEKGKFKTKSEAIIVDSVATLPHKYGIIFKTPNLLDIVDLTLNEVLVEDKAYVPRAYPGIIYSNNGSVIPGLEVRIWDENPLAPPDSLPKEGDLISINYSVTALRNNSDTVISNRPFSLEKVQSTTDGVIFRLEQPEVIQSVSRIGGTDNIEITFSVIDENSVVDGIYIVSVEGNGFDAENEGFISLSVKQNDNLILNIDTLYNLGTFEFNGISGRVEFPSDDPPSPGNIFSVESVSPIEPNVQDKYSFTIEGSKVNKNFVSENLNKIKVVPNPYVVSSLFEPEFGELRREPLRQIQFINLPTECTIYIFTVNADIVKTLHHSSTNGTETWDLRAEGGREIAPGVYIYVIKSENGEYIDRFAIIK